MSLGHQLAAWDIAPGDLSPQERVVLLALAEDCRSGRDVASPGHKILSDRTGLGRTQLSATIARLAARGLVALAERARRGRNAVYRLLFAERPANRDQSGSTGADHGSDSIRATGTLPGSSSPRKNPVARARDAASKIRKNRQGPVVLPPSNAPTNRLVPAPRPDRSALPTPPAWALAAASMELGGQAYASPSLVAALARQMAATGATA
ncbi:hypothetical protein FrEUN1fDRAFT_0350 [Parafrankia sp. EUN1f]|nr:hypothetical protein FrEUN1fDRAFT_0350 [Parafrankia sp. EUN1f]